MSQLAVLSACQIPLRFGLPSGVRGALYEGVCAEAVAIRITAADIQPLAIICLSLVQSDFAVKPRRYVSASRASPGVWNISGRTVNNR